MKKIFALIIMIVFCMPTMAFAESNTYTEGAYYQLGKYNDKPIIWRCVSTDDENGILMLSDKILCFKVANSGENSADNISNSSVYGDNFWENSTIRTWLNSDADEGKVEWLGYPPDYSHINTERFINYTANYPYENEKGFLNNDNFSESEKSVMKTVSQWQMLPVNHIELAENGCKAPFITDFYELKGAGNTEELGKVSLSGLVTWDVIYSDPARTYKGAAYRVTDTVFLLDELQLPSIYHSLGWDGFKCKAVEPPIDKTGVIHGSGESYSFWLRSPYNNISDYNWPNNNISFNTIALLDITSSVSGLEHGVRPAFYLNEDTTRIVSGSGTEDEPYILDGIEQEEITVFSNSKQVDFNQNPMIENDRTLVGMRAIFESLGAEVEWNGEEKSVTASTDDTTVKLQIDNNIMQVNDNEVELDTPARLINDNTMVPLRAVSEALDAKVEWVENLQRVVIDIQPAWIESDWNPEWYQQAMRIGGYLK